MTPPYIAIISLGVLIVVFGVLLFGGLMRRYRREVGTRPQEREKTPEVAFVINAFHEVTKQLKEKEKELERLKSLAEQRAETVESYTENILQCVTNGVIAFDRHGIITTINRAACEILSLSMDAAIGKMCSDIFKESEICSAVSETLETSSSIVRMEAVLDRPGGGLWLGYNTAVLSDRSGGSIGVILSFSDLTEVKRLQEQVELRERLTAIGEMSAGIAHELRNPMGVMAGYLNLLSKKSDASNREIIANILTEIDGMNRIIGDLLTFARPAALNKTRVNIQEMLSGCLGSVLQAKGDVGDITTELMLDDCEVFLDEGLMRQAFCNIIQNAVEAMPGGGWLWIRANCGRDITIVVEDTGIGIPRERLKKIFLPFFTTKDKGTGLGLALAHKIILSHGGRIETESEEGKGTRFTIVLPRA